jgi:hypothetical protein
MIPITKRHEDGGKPSLHVLRSFAMLAIGVMEFKGEVSFHVRIPSCAI